MLNTDNPTIAVKTGASSSHRYDFAGQKWVPYKEAYIIDGLADVIDASNNSLDTETLAIYRRSRITVVNDTFSYRGDDFAKEDTKVDHALSRLYLQN